MLLKNYSNKKIKFINKYPRIDSDQESGLIRQEIPINIGSMILKRSTFVKLKKKVMIKIPTKVISQNCISSLAAMELCQET